MTQYHGGCKSIASYLRLRNVIVAKNHINLPLNFDIYSKINNITIREKLVISQFHIQFHMLLSCSFWIIHKNSILL